MSFHFSIKINYCAHANVISIRCSFKLPFMNMFLSCCAFLVMHVCGNVIENVIHMNCFFNGYFSSFNLAFSLSWKNPARQQCNLENLIQFIHIIKKKCVDIASLYLFCSRLFYLCCFFIFLHVEWIDALRIGKLPSTICCTAERDIQQGWHRE